MKNIKKENKKKLNSEFVLLCDYANISREGKLNINGVFEEFRTTNLPGVLPRAYFVAALTGEPNVSHKIKLTLENGVVEELMQLEVVTGANGKANIIVELIAPRFISEGKHFIKIISENQEVGKAAIDVILMKKENPQEMRMPN